MNYYKKLGICFVLFLLCYFVIYLISRESTNTILENFTTVFDTYSFEKYYGNNIDPNSTTNYVYPVHFNKDYKNFSDNNVNYNDVYDAVYKNTNQKNKK
jgi:hypothetical protein|uniref:Uncharacterized protein n=1 Tax=viral metagenome TaxID=1070528 RepID=A0A6C0DHI4_9ZZZZ